MYISFVVTSDVAAIGSRNLAEFRVLLTFLLLYGCEAVCHLLYIYNTDLQ